jgi:hypothetical protein
MLGESAYFYSTRLRFVTGLLFGLEEPETPASLNVEKSDESNLYQERSDHEANMIRSVKRSVTLNVKRIVLYGDIKNQVSPPTN